MNDYPQEYEIEDAYGTWHGFVLVAWTDDDNVFIYKPWAPHPDREDGYQLIGTLAWEDRDGDTWAENEAHNTDRLDTFVQDYKNRMRLETGEKFVPPEVMVRVRGRGEGNGRD